MTDWILLSAFFIVLILLVGGGVLIHNAGFNSCEDELNQTIQDYDQRNRALSAWENNLNSREKFLNDTNLQMQNLTSELNDCRKLINTPSEISLVFFTLKYTPQEIQTIIFISIYSLAFCFIFPITLSIAKVKIEVNKTVKFSIIVSFIALILTILVLGAS